MPVRTQARSERRAADTRYQDLKRKLVEEWRGERSDGPEIVREIDSAGALAEVYVIWDEWSDLDAETRSELIVDALEEVEGDDAVLDLALAMGLTSGESARYGLS